MTRTGGEGMAQETWQRERLLEALESYRLGLSDAPHITKWSGIGTLGQRAELKDSGDEGPMTFVASTEDVDRHGDVIAVSGWRLEAYRKNPVFLWAHDYARPAIGKTTEAWTSSAGASVPALMVQVEFAPTEFAQEVAALYRGGYQRGVSVGFRPVRYEERRHRKSGEFLGIRFTEQELLEVSAAPVPANENALRKALAPGTKGVGAPRLKEYYSLLGGDLLDPLHRPEEIAQSEVGLKEILEVLRAAAI